MLTEQIFNKIRDGEVFAGGFFVDCPEKILVTDTHNEIFWWAKKGHGNDWAIYYASVLEYVPTQEFILKYGDKLYQEKFIRKLVDCSDDVFSRYRH